MSAQGDYPREAVADAPEAMLRLREELDADGEVQVSAREVTRWYASPRLTLTLRWQVSEHLAGLGLIATPPLDDATLDTILTVRRDGVMGRRAASVTPAPRASPEASEPLRSGAHDAPHTSPPSRRDLTIRLADVRDCMESAVLVAPEAPLSRAASLLATHKVPYLVVAAGVRTPRGVINWERVGRAALAQSNDSTIGAWTVTVEALDERTPLIEAAECVERDGAAVMIAADRTVTAVLTAHAAARALRRVATPFVLLDEIEQRMRRCFEERSPDALRDARAPTFGDYVRAIEHPDVYPRLGLGVEREVLRALVDEVRVIRNRCMHFASGGLGPNDLYALARLAAFLRDVR